MLTTGDAFVTSAQWHVTRKAACGLRPRATVAGLATVSALWVTAL